jgi:hypothetical protein
VAHEAARALELDEDAAGAREADVARAGEGRGAGLGRRGAIDPGEHLALEGVEAALGAHAGVAAQGFERRAARGARRGARIGTSRWPPSRDTVWGRAGERPTVAATTG